MLWAAGIYNVGEYVRYVTASCSSDVNQIVCLATESEIKPVNPFDRMRGHTIRLATFVSGLTRAVFCSCLLRETCTKVLLICIILHGVMLQ